MPLQTLRGRIIAASLLLALLIGVAFVALILSVRDARESARVAQRSEEVAATAAQLERLLVDLETGQRAYVITGQRSFLEPWEQALRTYPTEAERLRALVRDPAQRRRVETIREQMDSYVRDWSQRVVDAVPVSRDRAAELVATGEGRDRVDELRRLFDVFLERQRDLTEARSDAAEASAQRAVSLGLGGLAGSTLLVFLFASYLVRSAIAPIESVAGAARRLRAGEREARAVEVPGRDEAAAMTRDFNAMAQTLSDNFDELGRQRAELEAVLDAAVEGIAMTDADGNLVFTNTRMDAIWRDLGVVEKGSIWNRLAALAELTGQPETYAAAFALIASDPHAVVDDEFEAVALGRWFHGHTAPVTAADGSVAGRIFSLRETTETRAAEQAKDQFLSTVSHELRTPLTSIIGFTELVRQGEVGEVSREQDKFLSIVDRSARQLHALVDDLLTVGRTDEGRLDLDLEDVDLSLLAAEAVESASTAAGEKRVRVELEADEPAPLRGDRRRLAQLLANLVGNAIKFTPSGGRVDVRVRPGGGAVELVVADSGIGIAADDQPQLFRRFFRAATATAAEVPGTGLGLAISKEIAEAHGGTIAVESAEGAGTTVRVELPGEGGR